MQISEEFSDVLQWGGSIRITCVCGRIHFIDDETPDWEDGELEIIRAEMEDAPGAHPYVAHYEGARAAHFNGVEHVDGCECNSLGRIEAMLWENRKSIIEYLNKRAVKALADARADVEAVGNVSP